MAVVMTMMTVTSMTTTPTMVKMTVVVEALKSVGVEIPVAIASGPEHKSLESTRLHSLDML